MQGNNWVKWKKSYQKISNKSLTWETSKSLVHNSNDSKIHTSSWILFIFELWNSDASLQRRFDFRLEKFWLGWPSKIGEPFRVKLTPSLAKFDWFFWTRSSNLFWRHHKSLCQKCFALQTLLWYPKFSIIHPANILFTIDLNLNCCFEFFQFFTFSCSLLSFVRVDFEKLNTMQSCQLFSKKFRNFKTFFVKINYFLAKVGYYWIIDEFIIMSTIWTEIHDWNLQKFPQQIKINFGLVGKTALEMRLRKTEKESDIFPTIWLGNLFIKLGLLWAKLLVRTFYNPPPFKMWHFA